MNLGFATVLYSLFTEYDWVEVASGDFWLLDDAEDSLGLKNTIFKR